MTAESMMQVANAYEEQKKCMEQLLELMDWILDQPKLHFETWRMSGIGDRVSVWTSGDINDGPAQGYGRTPLAALLAAMAADKAGK